METVQKSSLSQSCSSTIFRWDTFAKLTALYQQVISNLLMWVTHQIGGLTKPLAQCQSWRTSMNKHWYVWLMVQQQHNRNPPNFKQPFYKQNLIRSAIHHVAGPLRILQATAHISLRLYLGHICLYGCLLSRISWYYLRGTKPQFIRWIITKVIKMKTLIPDLSWHTNWILCGLYYLKEQGCNHSEKFTLCIYSTEKVGDDLPLIYSTLWLWCLVLTSPRFS